jgi:hypothetical protein
LLSTGVSHRAVARTLKVSEGTVRRVVHQDVALLRSPSFRVSRMVPGRPNHELAPRFGRRKTAATTTGSSTPRPDWPANRPTGTCRSWGILRRHLCFYSTKKPSFFMLSTTVVAILVVVV